MSEKEISYRSIREFGNGKPFLYGFDKYKCSGSCFCEENRITASIGLPVSRGMVLFVSSVSSILAYKKAKEHFQQDCEKRLFESCNKNYVRSKVEVCDNFEVIEEGEHEIIDITDKSKKRYLCSGKCLPIDFKDAITHLEMSSDDKKDLKINFKRKQKKNECRGFSTSSHIEVDPKSPQSTAISLGQGGGTIANENLAKFFFILQKLQPFCVDKSLLDTSGLKIGGQSSDNFQVRYCAGFDSSTTSVDPKKINPSVKCVEVGKDDKEKV